MVGLCWLNSGKQERNGCKGYPVKLLLYLLGLVFSHMEYYVVLIILHISKVFLGCGHLLGLIFDPFFTISSPVSFLATVSTKSKSLSSFTLLS